MTNKTFFQFDKKNLNIIYLINRLGKQHTLVETDSVRYVYQPLEKLYVVLLTTKASNILEDLETLRLFAKVIPEYSRSLDEYDIRENIFEIIFAFDEIVALGYRENVNLAQIRTFTEMHSHEEKVFLTLRENQEKGAIANMRKKAKELQAKRENKDKSVTTAKPIVKSKSSSGNTMRLGGKVHVVDSFVDQLKAEGVRIDQPDDTQRPRALSGSYSGNQTEKILIQENIHIKIEERLKIETNHETGLLNMELFGILILRIADNDSNLVRLKIDLGNALQSHTHPNVDKKMFQNSNILQSKSAEKAFPVGQDIGLLKWSLQTDEVDTLPLIINCWPTKTSKGCDVSIEYELQNKGVRLHDVVVTITLPPGAGTPIVTEVNGEYSFDHRKTHLLWNVPLVDADNACGSMEFETKVGQVENFFPLSVTFYSDMTLSGLKMVDVFDQSSNSVNFSSDTSLVVDKYEIV